jgi:hypothetical protein
MILGFKQNFVLPIIDGRKIHTIREDKHERWEPGRKIHMATQVRTKNMDIFAMHECKLVQRIVFVWTEIKGEFVCHVFIDHALAGPIMMEQLAKNDGFESVEAFLKWEAWDKQNFKGRLIHWTDKKY